MQLNYKIISNADNNWKLTVCNIFENDCVWRKCENCNFEKIDDEFQPLQPNMEEEITVHQWPQWSTRRTSTKYFKGRNFRSWARQRNFCISREETFAFERFQDISREETFADGPFWKILQKELSRKGQKTAKQRKFLPTKVSSFKVHHSGAKRKKQIKIVPDRTLYQCSE